MKRIGIGSTLGGPGSSGVYALNLALQAARKGMSPRLLSVAEPLELDVLHRRLLAPALAEYDTRRDAFACNPEQGLPFPVLQPLGDRLALSPGADHPCGSTDIGLAFFSHLDIPPENLQRAADRPLLIAGSSWHTRVLRDKGLRNVLTCPPGIDPALFHPAPRAGLFPGRFAIFSGGRLAYRHGQDMVIAAFRIFHQRHPEALLVCGWTAPSPQDMRELSASPHIENVPEVANGILQVTPWLARNGIAPEAVVELGLMRHSQLPGVLRECDLAVFPQRCTSGTPLSAMEALACGLPVVLAGNTGHLDLVGDHLYVLKEQGDVAALCGDPGKEGWGECAVEELLETMERAYARRSEAEEKGRAAARFMQGWTWERQADRLLAAVDQAVAGTSVPPPGVEEEYRWGLGLHRAGRLAEAERVYDAVLQQAPAHVAARGDRGNVRRDRGDLRGAEADFRKILAAQPGNPRALHSLGRLLRRGGQLDEAAACLQRALAGADTPAMHWDLAFTLLLMGRYGEAWPHFEHRHAALGLRTADPAKPRWDGQPVTGTLLVLDEQGLGDTMQFLRFLPRIPVAPGGRVIFAGKPETLPVVRRMLPTADVFRWDQPLPRSQAWIPLMSLPGRLGVMRPEDIPPPLAGSLVEPERVARWRPLVRGAGERPVVGLCWRGNPNFPDDALRSPGLAALRSILDVQGLRFVSLQVGPGRREIAELGLAGRLDDVGAAIEAAGPEVLDTLAVLENCDFVLSCCTSVAHMAGVAGRPGRVLLASRPDWRWMMERVDTPWYPSLGLIRQCSAGDWAGVATEAAAQLTAFVPPSPSVVPQT